MAAAATREAVAGMVAAAEAAAAAARAVWLVGVWYRSGPGWHTPPPPPKMIIQACVFMQRKWVRMRMGDKGCRWAICGRRAALARGGMQWLGGCSAPMSTAHLPHPSAHELCQCCCPDPCVWKMRWSVGNSRPGWDFEAREAGPA